MVQDRVALSTPFWSVLSCCHLWFLSVSLRCPLAPIPNAPWFSSDILAPYQSPNYLLTY